MDLAEIIGRSVVVYAAVLAGLRLGGRREIGQLTPFDLVVILLVANADRTRRRLRQRRN